MAEYRLLGSDEVSKGELIVSTHPAQPGTCLVYAHADGTHQIVDVVLWGVLADGVAVPITMAGVWDGTSNENKFVLHPSGRCGTYDREWESLGEALSEMKELAPR